MSMLDTILGGVMGGGASSPLRAILASVLGGNTGPGAPTQPGLGGLLEQFTRAGHGDTFNSWVGSGQNRSIDPSALGQVFGQDQVNGWSQQTGLPPHDLLSQLSQFLPHAIDQMTPNGTLPTGKGDSPFDTAGTELPPLGGGNRLG